MLDQVNVEQRLSALEQTVAELQQRVAVVPPSGNWLEKIAGSVSDEPAFLKALEFGRAFRLADRPPDEAGE